MHVNELRKRILQNLTKGFSKTWTMPTGGSDTLDALASKLQQWERCTHQLRDLQRERREQDRLDHEARETAALTFAPFDYAAEESRREAFWDREDALANTIVAMENEVLALASELNRSNPDSVITGLFGRTSFFVSPTRRRRQHLQQA